MDLFIVVVKLVREGITSVGPQVSRCGRQIGGNLTQWTGLTIRDQITVLLAIAVWIIVRWICSRRARDTKEQEVRNLVDNQHAAEEGENAPFTKAVAYFGALARAKLGSHLVDTPANRLVANKLVADLMEDKDVRVKDRIRIAPFVAAGLFIPTLWEVEAAAIRSSAYARDRAALAANPGHRAKFKHQPPPQELTWREPEGEGGPRPSTPPATPPESLPSNGPESPTPNTPNQSSTLLGIASRMVSIGWKKEEQRPLTQSGYSGGLMTPIRFGTWDE